MSTLVVADPLEELDATVDASVGLMVALEAEGEEVAVCTPGDLTVVDGRVHARVRGVRLRPRRRGADHRWRVAARWFEATPASVRDVAASFDLVLLRIDPPVDARYLHTTHLLDLVADAGVPVENDPSGIRSFHEKLAALAWPDLCPRTVVAADPAALREFVAEVGAAVLKPVDGFGGAGVWQVRDDRAATAFLESATAGGRRHVIAQKYLARVEEGNKRLFLLDGEILGAVARRPLGDDFRIGPPVASAPVTDADRRIVDRVAGALCGHGLRLAGIDVIDDLLIEVNVTCPGGTAKADALLGTDLSGTIARRLLVHRRERTAS